MVTPLALGASAAADPGATPDEQGKGFLLLQRFDGSTSSDGKVLQLTSTAGWNFSKSVGVDFAFPYYFIVAPSRPLAKSDHGVGDVALDLRITLTNPLLNFATIATVTAPTGNTRFGLSSGRATWDWTNRAERGLGNFTPFVEAGVGDSISNVNRRSTLGFKRPFNTLGNMAHFEAGTQIGILGPLSFSVSAYDILPWGNQKLYSRLVQRGTTGTTSGQPVFLIFPVAAGDASLTRDNGYNASLNLSLLKYMDFSLGYSRSIPLRLDTVSFGVGFNLTPFVKGGPSK